MGQRASGGAGQPPAIAHAGVHRPRPRHGRRSMDHGQARPWRRGVRHSASVHLALRLRPPSAPAARPRSSSTPGSGSTSRGPSLGPQRARLIRPSRYPAIFVHLRSTFPQHPSAHPSPPTSHPPPPPSPPPSLPRSRSAPSAPLRAASGKPTLVRVVRRVAVRGARHGRSLECAGRRRGAERRGLAEGGAEHRGRRRRRRLGVVCADDGRAVEPSELGRLGGGGYGEAANRGSGICAGRVVAHVALQCLALNVWMVEVRLGWCKLVVCIAHDGTLRVRCMDTRAVAL